MQLIQGLEIGGPEKLVVDLVLNLDRKKYNLSICCYDKLGTFANKLREEGSSIFLCKRRQGKDYLYPFKLASLIRKKRVQILHMHNETALFYGTIAGKLARIPILIYTEHDGVLPRRLLIAQTNRILSLLNDQVIAVSGYLRNYLVSLEKMDPRKVTIIYNGVDARRFDSNSNNEEEKLKIKSELCLDGNIPIVGTIARLDPEKNHQCLLRAIQKICKELPDVVLLLVGDGSIRGELQSLTASLGIINNVRFLGSRGDIPQILSIFDIFVLSSLREGLPVALIEATAMGIPIVATNVGGNSEVVENGVNGILVSSNDEVGLAKAIVELLRDRELAKKMGKSGRRIFENKFTLDSMVGKYEEIYDYFIKKKLERET
jgi:sugar transferase (PEP-CTERM/EpsH1 system associated)